MNASKPVQLQLWYTSRLPMGSHLKCSKRSSPVLPGMGIRSRTLPSARQAIYVPDSPVAFYVNQSLNATGILFVQIMSDVVVEDLVAKRLELYPRQFPGRLVLNLELTQYLASGGAANALDTLERIRQPLIIRNLRVPDTNSSHPLGALEEPPTGIGGSSS